MPRRDSSQAPASNSCGARRVAAKQGRVFMQLPRRIVVNDSGAGTIVVFLRGLDIFGVNPPSNGVRFISGAALHIEDSVIRQFNAANSAGISFAPSGPAELYVSNTVIAENGNGATGQ